MSSEADDFEKYIILEAMKEVKEVTEDADRLLKKNVQSELYDNYTPKVYTRTNELKKSITSKIEATEGITYFDESKLNHTSVVTGEPSGKYVPMWTDQGHKDSTGIENKFHNYEGRNFIDKTINELEEKYGKDCAKKIDE